MFGVALVIAVHWWISSAAHEDAALVAAAFTAGSYFLIEYSTIARGYTMVAVGFVVLLELSRRILGRGGTAGCWAMWIVVSVLGFATIPVFAYPFITAISWIVVSGLGGRTADSAK